MSGEWLKIEVSLPAKPEVMRIGRILGLSPDAVCGLLIRFWGWATLNSVDGSVTQLALQDIDMIVTLPGFAEAMVSVGWLQTDKKNNIFLPNFERHNSQSSKKRALSALRQATFRNAKVTLPALPDKSRLDNIRTISTAVALPDWIDKEKWEAYVKTRKAKAREPESLKAAIEKLDGFRAAGHDPNQIIATSLANGWQGLFEPKGNGKGGNGSGPPWWASNEGIQAKAAELGIASKLGESWNDLKARVNEQLGAA